MPGPVAKKACHNLLLRGHTQEAGLDVGGGGISCSYRICTMSCAGARKGSHRREICKGLGGHKVVCNLNFPYSKLGQVPASQASTLVMGQHLQEEKKEEEEKKKKKWTSVMRK